MAEPVIVATLETDEFSDVAQFDRAIGQFGPGEMGQIDIPLDPVVAIDEYITEIEQSVISLDQALRDEGLLPWPGFAYIAYLEWEDRKVRILFRTPSASPPAPPANGNGNGNDIDPGDQGERVAYVPGRHAGVKDVLESAVSVAATDNWHVAQHSSPHHAPSVWAFALFGGLLRGTGTALTRDAGFRAFAARYGVTIAAGMSGRLALQAGRQAFKQAVRAGRATGRLPVLVSVPGAILLLYMIQEKTGIPVLSWPADKVKEYVLDPIGRGAEEAAKKVLDKVAEEIEKVAGDYSLYIIGGVAVLGGLWLATR